MADAALDVPLRMLFAKLTCDKNFVNCPVFLIGLFSRNVIAKANSGHRYKTVVKRVKEIPLHLYRRKYRRRDDEH
jgi:hypothetical protein